MKTILSLIALFISINIQAQDSTQVQHVGKGFGVSVAQVLPEFPGGEDSLHSFLKSNITYPYSAKVNRIQGRVYIGFLVDKTGKILNAKVLSSVSKEIDEEALRVVKLMPSWKPGTRGGTPADVQFILPIDFITPPLQGN